MTDPLTEAVAREALKAFAMASGLGILPDDENDEDWREDLLNGMKAALAAARPVIRAEALEEAARLADAAHMVHGSSLGVDDLSEVAAAIRALKDSKP